MAKLYPPGIEGKIPAFAGSTLRIPFTLNRAVGLTEVNKMACIIKNVQTNQQVGDKLIGSWAYNEKNDTYYAQFDLGNRYSSQIAAGKVCPGQFYKVQLAFIDANNAVGYYSSIGVIKCTTKPVLAIPALESNYYGSQEYLATYSQPANGLYDVTEKEYSYCFELRDGNGTVVATSGELAHNTAEDKSATESQDRWSLKLDLEDGKPYYLVYKVTTMNGLTAETQGYVIISQETVDIEMPAKLVAKQIPEDGLVALYLRPTKTGGFNGSYILSRSSSENDYKTWDEISRFTYKHFPVEPRPPKTHPEYWDDKDILIWEDYTVAQGVDYIYSLQAYNMRGLHSNRMLNEEEVLVRVEGDRPELYQYISEFVHTPITVDFEDMFLYDGERQLKIRFNPKVASFKSAVLESKIDTLGGKYPFVFRNGNVEYKEFPIAGLLSLISDPNERFLEGIQNNIYLARSATPAAATSVPDLDTMLTSNNIRREREFKMKALDWLTDGKIKLFRSPTEGNFIVRLFNVSMTPNDQLSRMLHSFTSTAYEIADCNYDNLVSFGIVQNPMTHDRSEDIKIGQFFLNSPPSSIIVVDGQIRIPNTYWANITEAIPGTVIGLNFADGVGTIRIEIGATGNYYIPLHDKSLSYIQLLEGEWGEEAKITFCYYDDTPTDHIGNIANMSIKDEFRQFIGSLDDYIGDKYYVGYPSGRADAIAADKARKTAIYQIFNDKEPQTVSWISEVDKREANDEPYNYMNRINDCRRKATKFHYIKILKRPIWNIYQVLDENGNATGDYSYNAIGNDILNDVDWNPTIIYKIYGRPRSEDFSSWSLDERRAWLDNPPDIQFLNKWILNCSIINNNGTTRREVVSATEKQAENEKWWAFEINYLDGTHTDTPDGYVDFGGNPGDYDETGTGMLTNSYEDVTNVLADAYFESGKYWYKKIINGETYIYLATSFDRKETYYLDDKGKTVIKLTNDRENVYEIDKFYYFNADEKAYRLMRDPARPIGTSLFRRIFKHPETAGRIEAITNVENIKSIFMGKGVMMDVCYRVKEYDYVVEENNTRLKELRNLWLGAVSWWNEINSRSWPIDDDEKMAKRYKEQNLAYYNVIDSYKAYEAALKEALAYEASLQ